MAHRSTISAVLAHPLTAMMDALPFLALATNSASPSKTLLVLDASSRQVWPASNAQAEAKSNESSLLQLE